MDKHYSDAQITIRTLLRGETRAKANDKRRILSQERCRLMTAIAQHKRGRITDAELALNTAEARRVNEMWASIA